MLLSISTTHKPATDLGFLLLKNPQNVHTVELSFGKAHVFYPEANDDFCQATLLLDVDAVGLVRGKGAGSEGLEQYVNDRPYVASSFLSVAISRVLGTALSGRSKQKQDLADSKLPFKVNIPALPCRGGETLLNTLFAPLGYEIKAQRLALDAKFTDWGESRYFNLELSNNIKLKDLLSHLYVLIPVLDDDKHYFVGQSEVEKLLKHGEGWLSTHPAKQIISTRYLLHKRNLAQLALSQLMEEEEDPVEKQERLDSQEEAVERPLSLNEQRIQTVIATLKQHQIRSVIDLGCGEGRYMKELLQHREFEALAGIDVSPHVLDKAADRLKLDRLPEKRREKISLFQSSLVYRDARIKDYEAAICIEVIEHMDLPRVPVFESILFKHARPRLVILSTPNIEYNKKFETLTPGKLRHGDHRFEWTRAEFQAWARSAAANYGYNVEFAPIGPVDEELGPPTQMAVFILKEAAVQSSSGASRDKKLKDTVSNPNAESASIQQETLEHASDKGTASDTDSERTPDTIDEEAAQ